MNEEHLIEIATKIIKSDGPLERGIYIKKLLFSLDENEFSELQLFLNNPKYAKLNIFDKYLGFANDYLKSKNITISEIIPVISDESESREMDTSYLDDMLAEDKLISKGKK